MLQKLLNRLQIMIEIQEGFLTYKFHICQHILHKFKVCLATLNVDLLH